MASAPRKASGGGGLGGNQRLRKVGEYLESKDVKGSQQKKDTVSQRRTAQLLALSKRKKKSSSEDRRVGNAKAKPKFSSSTGAQTRRAPAKQIPKTK